MTVLRAPLAGWLAPLDEVPDPVFGERMMGDGFAIDPTEGLVTAPCAGIVSAVAPTGHSVTLAADGGGTILIHVGLETVALGGDGFAPLVAAGEAVAAGQPLLRFDLDMVARGARSLLTPVVAIGEGDRIVIGATGRLVTLGEPVGGSREAGSQPAVILTKVRIHWPQRPSRERSANGCRLPSA